MSIPLSASELRFTVRCILEKMVVKKIQPASAAYCSHSNQLCKIHRNIEHPLKIAHFEKEKLDTNGKNTSQADLADLLGVLSF